MSSQAQDFYTNSCLTCHENKAANKRNHPRDKRGEQSALTAMDKSNLRPQLSSSVNYNTIILMNRNVFCAFNDDRGRFIVIVDRCTLIYLDIYFPGRYEKYNCHVDPF